MIKPWSIALLQLQSIKSCAISDWLRVRHSFLTHSGASRSFLFCVPASCDAVAPWQPSSTVPARCRMLTWKMTIWRQSLIPGIHVYNHQIFHEFTISFTLLCTDIWRGHEIYSIIYLEKAYIVYTHHFLHLAHHDRRPFEWPWLWKRRSSRSLALRQKGQQRKGTEQLGLVQLRFLP